MKTTLTGTVSPENPVPLTVSAYYVGTGFSRLTVPVGVVFMYLFGGLLLVVERA